MARKAIKKAIRKVTKKVTKKRVKKAKPRRVHAAKDTGPDVSEISRDAIMHQVEELVKATAMNGGLVPDNESKMIDIENAVRSALGLPSVSSRTSLVAHSPGSVA